MNKTFSTPLRTLLFIDSNSRFALIWQVFFIKSIDGRCCIKIAESSITCLSGYSRFISFNSLGACMYILMSVQKLFGELQCLPACGYVVYSILEYVEMYNYIASSAYTK